MTRKTVDATPPADFPAQMILLDRAAAQRHPERGFYLRVAQSNGDVAYVELGPELTLVGAVHAAYAKGYRPTHW